MGFLIKILQQCEQMLTMHPFAILPAHLHYSFRFRWQYYFQNNKDFIKKFLNSHT